MWVYTGSTLGKKGIAKEFKRMPSGTIYDTGAAVGQVKVGTLDGKGGLNVVKKYASAYSDRLNKLVEQCERERVEECIGKGICPQCRSETGLKEPRGSERYCEDCGWPDENRQEEKVDEAKMES